MADRLLLNESKGYGKCVSFKAHKDLDRGMFLEIAGVSDSPLTVVGGADHELLKVKDASETTKRGNLVVNISVPKMYDEKLTERDYFTAKDSVGRGRIPETMCTHIYAASLVESGVQEGDFLKIGAGQLVKDADGTNAIAVVKEVLNWEGQESVKVRYL